MPTSDGRVPMSRISTVHNLAESTTFAEDDLSLRRQAAFGAAVRHSRRVGFMPVSYTHLTLPTILRV